MFRWHCEPIIQEHLGTECEITSTFKLNAPLGNAVEDMGKLDKDRTNRDYIIIVGGSGNTTIPQLKRASVSLQKG